MSANKPIQSPTQGDMPTDWQDNDIISKDGVSVGKPEKYGYNYLMSKINSICNDISKINNYFTNLPTSTELTSIQKDLQKTDSEINKNITNIQNNLEEAIYFDE